MNRICFFSGDITRSGGTEKVSTIIANELATQGKYDICFLSLCEQKDTMFYPLHKNISRYKLGEKWIQPGPAYLPLVPKLRHFLKEQKIDVIIDIDIVLDSLSIPATWKLKTKVLSWEHSNCFFELSVLYRKLILKYSVKHSDYVVTLTEGDKKNYEQLLKRTKNIEAIYNPMEEPKEGKVQDNARENRMITVGHLVSGKGMEYLAEVAVKVLKKHPDWKWYLLGEGAERSFLETVIEENNLQEQLILTGLVSNVGEYLEESKIFVLTSKSEGLPMCLLEAKAYKLPCVSFDIQTGPNEIIEENVNGFLVEPFDCVAMADSINRLIEDEELLRCFSENTNRNLDKFQMANIIAKWNRVLDKLCE